MNHLAVEVTVRRIGGPVITHRDRPSEEVWRQWGPKILPLAPGSSSDWIPDSNDGRHQLGMFFEGYAPLDDEFGAGIIELTDTNGSPIGKRPFLLYRRPYNVPTYTAVQDRWPAPHYRGLFQVGLRVIGKPGKDTDQ